jgi:UDP-glucose 4-epimerase
MLLGFNPRIQVLHPDDAAAAFALAARHTASGAVNLAAADPLPLAQAIRLAGKQPAPLPGMLLRTTDWPYGRDFLRYSCVGDTRRARAVLAWEPTYSARSILRELATNEVRSGTATDAPSPPCLEQEPV